MGVFKRSDIIGSSISCGYADDMVLNPTLDVLSSITRGGCNFQGENPILIYLNVFKNFMYAGRAFRGERGVTEMIRPPNILAFVDKNNPQPVRNVASVLFNTKVKSLKHYGHICTFRNVMLASLMHHNKALKFVALETNITTVSLH